MGQSEGQTRLIDRLWLALVHCAKIGRLGWSRDRWAEDPADPGTGSLLRCGGEHQAAVQQQQHSALVAQVPLTADRSNGPPCERKEGSERKGGGRNRGEREGMGKISRAIGRWSGEEMRWRLAPDGWLHSLIRKGWRDVVIRRLDFSAGPPRSSPLRCWGRRASTQGRGGLGGYKCQSFIVMLIAARGCSVASSKSVPLAQSLRHTTHAGSPSPSRCAS